MHKLLWDFEIQTDHLISARRPDLIIINKKKEIFIIKGFRTIVVIFIVMSLLGVCRSRRTFTELRTTSFTETTGMACSDSVNHNWVQMLSIPVLLGLNLQPPDDCLLREPLRHVSCWTI